MDDLKKHLTSQFQAVGRLNEITYNFKLLDTDELRILTILRLMEIFETIPEANCKIKDTQTSIDLRNIANKLFRTKKVSVYELIAAWELYSQSIAYALNDSLELSLSYANRSAVLIKLHKYKECIEDIDRALSLDYPDNLRGKLLCRKIECLKVLNKTESLNDTLEEVQSWLEQISFSDDEKETFERKLKASNTSLASNNNSPQTILKKDGDLPIIPLNEQIPCASDALTVCYNEKFGRHVVTTRDVHPGEILIVEKPYSKILSLDDVYTHCSHCLQAHWALIPCESCVYAMYCSKECKDIARRDYHDIECGVIGCLVELGFRKDGLFSLRLAIRAVKEKRTVDDLRERLENEERMNETKPYYSDNYENIHNLVTSVDQRTVGDLFERSLHAATILYFLCTETNFLGKKECMKDIYMDENATFVGGLILRHMQIIPCNIHSYEEERQLELEDIGSMALPFCSLLNHSCDPNVSRCSSKDCMLVFAIMPIKKGEQVYDNYGSHYAVMTRDERRSKLKQYYFECDCIACTKNWPLYVDLPSYRDLVEDEETIRKIEDLLENLEMYVHDAKEDLLEDKSSAMEVLSKMIDNLIGLLPSLPCSEVNSVVETLKRVVTLNYGNRFIVPYYK